MLIEPEGTRAVPPAQPGIIRPCPLLAPGHPPLALMIFLPQCSHYFRRDTCLLVPGTLTCTCPAYPTHVSRPWTQTTANILPIVWLLAPVFCWLQPGTWPSSKQHTREGGGAEAESVELRLVHTRGRWGLTSRSLMEVIRPWRKQLASCP